MITLNMIKKICGEHDLCNECPFYNNELNERCLFAHDPCFWDMDKISKALDDSKMIDMFYESLNRKLLQVVRGKND